MGKPRKKAARKQDALQPHPATEQSPPPVTPEAIAQAFTRLRQRANQGDPRAREALKKYLDTHPEIWSRLGNLARHAESALIEVASDGEWLTSEAVRREAERMRQELAGPSPSPLEKMAIERVVVTWLQLQHSEMRFLHAQQNLGWAKYWLRRQEQADKLYRAAIGSLMLIRDLLPGAAPVGAAIVADASTPADGSEANDAIEVTVPTEILTNGTPGANRIANLLALPTDVPRSATNGHVNGKPKLNGHNHRLDDLLAHQR